MDEKILKIKVLPRAQKRDRFRQPRVLIRSHTFPCTSSYGLSRSAENTGNVRTASQEKMRTIFFPNEPDELTLSII